MISAPSSALIEHRIQGYDNWIVQRHVVLNASNFWRISKRKNCRQTVKHEETQSNCTIRRGSTLTNHYHSIPILIMTYLSLLSTFNILHIVIYYLVITLPQTLTNYHIQSLLVTTAASSGHKVAPNNLDHGHERTCVARSNLEAL